MTLEEAKEIARIQSEEGYVQHVNRYWSQTFIRTGLEYTVSDWFDDTTVISFENGKEL